MAKNTLTAWATPVGSPVLSEIADHTFVVCGSTAFKCWGGSDTNHPDAAKIISGSGESALCRAANYRGVADSACIGIYMVNGVCHQSTNLFLYAAGGTTLPVNKSRPRGIIASHALYAVYGVTTPASLLSAPIFMAGWVSTFYAQACIRCAFYSKKKTAYSFNANAILDGMDTNALTYKINKSYLSPADDRRLPIDDAVNDMGIIIEHHLGVDKHPAENAHVGITAERTRILTEYGLTKQEIQFGKVKLSSSDIGSITNKLNSLAEAFQDELQAKVGMDGYIELNGDDNIYRPINPEIAKSALSDLSVYR